ncbi:subtilisin-like protein [Trametes coccinea BRFM310]|uniref:tripeptidyl-peptidase II n=1 Tax=Trametes coccinea (strain BRFM310) TaxID=1353009 RepID=A0A1Y2IZU0_TRAC3|nr:subtilisin-like protein [Trametes coccinea BRFM310]
MLTSHTLLCLLGVVATLTNALGSSPPFPRILHERRMAPPLGWHPLRRADPDTILPLSIALRQSNIHHLDDYLFDVADPDSPNYGRWWTPEQIIGTFQPSLESSETVREWLFHEGIDAHRVDLSKDRAYLRVNVSVSEAERLLATSYYVYQHEDGSEEVGCHHGYHLPEHVVEHVDLVTPTVHFEKVRLHAHAGRRKRSAAAASDYSWQMRRPQGVSATKPSMVYAHAENCDKMATIDCFRALYNFYPKLTQTHRNTVGVVETTGNDLNGNDLDIFLKKFSPAAVGAQLPTFVGIDTDDKPDFGETDPNLISEADLDFELMIGLLGKEQKVTLYDIGQSGSFNFLLDAFDASYCSFEGGDDPEIDGVVPNEDCGDKPRSNVISISFVGGEDLPPAYMQRQCTEFGKLSMMGITFLVASGDDGVASNGDNLCLAANGTPVPGPGAFLPNFPATCPYVTAVGATQVDPGKSVHDPESAPTAFGSGGGFSNVFPRPSFQERLVQRYLAQLGRHAVDPTLFNSSGRGIPDVAANGFPTAAVIAGNYSIVGGTSASTPIFAAIVAAVNDARLALGKSPVGPINPAIYSILFTGAFHDVTNGTNPGCGTNGFPALAGWDPVTGLGTPNFPQLLLQFLALP